MPINMGANLQMPFIPTSTPVTFNLGRDTGHNGGHGQLRGRGPSGGRFRWGYTKHTGIFDASSMDSKPLNIFENQVIPTGFHGISKSFRPNVATTRVFSMGTKFIPLWKNVKF